MEGKHKTYMSTRLRRTCGSAIVYDSARRPAKTSEKGCLLARFKKAAPLLWGVWETF